MSVSDANPPAGPGQSEVQIVESGSPTIRVATPTAPPTVVTAPPTVPGLLRALRRRWLLALCLAVLGGGGGFTAAWFGMPNAPHSARALLYLAAHTPRVVFDIDRTADFNSFRHTQLALIKSRLVLNAALRQPKVSELSVVREQTDPIMWLERELRVGFTNSPEILSVTMAGDRPEELQKVVEAVVTAYLTEIVNKDHASRQARLDHLKEIYNRYDDNLRRKRKTMRELAEGVTGSTQQETVALRQKFAQEQLAMSQRELLQLRSDLRRLQLEARSHEVREPEADLPAELVAELARKDSTLQRYLASREQLEQDLDVTRQNAVRGDQEPAVIRLKEQLAALEQMIVARQQSLLPRASEALREQARKTHDLKSAGYKRSIQYYKELERLLAADVARMSEEGKVLTKGAIDLESFRTEIQQAEEVAKRVADEVEKLSVELLAPPRVKLLEEATPVYGEGALKRLRMAGMAAVVVAVGLVALLSLWEFRRRRVDSVEQVVHGLGMRLVGTVPASPSSGPKLLGGGGRAREVWRSVLHESVSAARSMLLHTSRTERLRVVMITSAVAGEGKTTLATQLAASLARAGRKTLLVDCDLRSPSAHRIFDAEVGPGVCEVLRAETEVHTVFQPTSVEGLWLIPAGECGFDVLQLLAQDGMRPIFGWLRQQFDFVIVDCCPVLPVADALLIGQHVDGVIFSVMRDVSQLPRVHAASQRLRSLGIRLLGAVVSGTREDTDSYGYNYVARSGR